MIVRFLETLQRRQQHPREPWLWRRDWAERAVRDSSFAGTGCLWAFAILWCFFSLPVAVLAPVRGQAEPFFYIGLIFPAVGVFMLAAAAAQTVRRTKYGRSVCRIAQLPVPLGGTLRAEIEANVRETPAAGFVARLTCVRRVTTRRGKSSSTSESILWDAEQTIAHGAMPGPNGVRIPVRFDIPRELPPADVSNAYDRIIWRLTVTADVPGIDYHATFELPVFAAEGDAAQDVFYEPPRAQPAAWTPPPEITLGFPEIVVRAPRTFGDFAGYAIFLGAWFGVGFFFFRRGGFPDFILLFIGGIGALVLLLALDYLFGRTTLIADMTALTVRRTWMGIGRTSVIPSAEIARIESRGGATVGSRRFHDLHAVLRNGRSRKIAKYIANGHDANMLASRLKQTLGVSS